MLYAAQRQPLLAGCCLLYATEQPTATCASVVKCCHLRSPPVPECCHRCGWCCSTVIMGAACSLPLSPPWRSLLTPPLPTLVQPAHSPSAHPGAATCSLPLCPPWCCHLHTPPLPALVLPPAHSPSTHTDAHPSLPHIGAATCSLPSPRMLPQVRLVLEYCDGGSLRDALDSKAFGSSSGEYSPPHLRGSYSVAASNTLPRYSLLLLRLC